jgi:26S proteasome regulatory subunit N3
MTLLQFDRNSLSDQTDNRFMLAALRTATLRYDTDTQGTLLTLLLRNFVHYKLYDQADKLVSRTTFPESSGNNLYARYLYYLGRIRAIQLDYSAAHQNLLTAIRKAPQNKAAAGFLQTVQKFFVVVELLMGDIPERSTFRTPMFEKVLAPYAQIVQGRFHAGVY